MSHAQRIHEYGGPEVMRWEAVEVPSPGPGEVQLRHDAVGVNFIDIYMRTGLYPMAEMPFIPGLEAAGTVIGCGEGVTEHAEGDRVAYAGPMGGYGEINNVPAERCVQLPNGIASDVAASCFLQGMTARFLLKETYEVGPETTMLLHAAAGGAGLMIAQWASHLGATIIGTAGGAEKCALAKENGCTHVIDYRAEDFVARTAELTDGKGADVVYDPVGKDTYPGSLDCLKPRGMWVPFGQASGVIDPIDIRILSQKKSLFTTRPMLFDYIASREELLANANDLFYMLSKGHIKPAPNHRYALEDAGNAHRDLEARKTTGSIILMP